MVTEAIQYIPLERFICDDNIRTRLNQELVEQIAQSFLSVGQLQPVRARPSDDRFKMVEGYHRFAAAERAKFKTLAAIIEQRDLGEGEVLQRQLIANCQRAELSVLETARAVQRLMEATGWNASQTANGLGFSNAKVSRLSAILTLPSSILAQIESGKIPPSAAYELVHVSDATQQAELAEQIANGALTRDATTRARKAARRPTPSDAPSVSRVTALLGESRSITVASPGLTLESLIVVIEELLAKARRERTRGTELSTFISLLRDQARAK